MTAIYIRNMFAFQLHAYVELRVSAIYSDVTVPVRTRAQRSAGVGDIDKNRPAKRAEKMRDILLYRQKLQGAGSEIRDVISKRSPY